MGKEREGEWKTLHRKMGGKKAGELQVASLRWPVHYYVAEVVSMTWFSPKIPPFKPHLQTKLLAREQLETQSASVNNTTPY